MTKDIDAAALRCFVSAVRTGSMGRAAEALATRYDKLAANYLAFVQLASIRLLLRVNGSALSSGGTHNQATRLMESDRIDIISSMWLRSTISGGDIAMVSPLVRK